MSETPEEAVARIAAERGGKPKRKPGRPSKYDAAIHVPAVERTAQGGATWSLIAQACDVSLPTVMSWAEKHSEFLEAVTHAKDAADDLVENALFRRALGDWNTPPDTKACTVWLGNRRPKKWRDTSRIEVEGTSIQRVTIVDSI